MITKAEFIQGSRGKLFYLERSSCSKPKSLLLVIQSFGEEMNKSRHMLTQLSQRLVKSEYMVILYDFWGTGDSDGELEDATLALWRDDLNHVMKKLAGDFECPISVLCLRAGTMVLLGSETARTWRTENIVLLNPVTNGKLFLGQLLRLKLAGSLFSGDSGAPTMADLKHQLTTEGGIEVAGYYISETLAREMEEFEIGVFDEFLRTPNESQANIHWIELNSQEKQDVSPQAKKAISAIQANNMTVCSRTLKAPQFWSTQEITVASDLPEVVLQCLQ